MKVYNKIIYEVAFLIALSDQYAYCMDLEESLRYAAETGNLEETERLVAKVPEEQKAVFVNQSDSACKTALHLACGSGHIAVVRYLLGVGAQINCQDIVKWTPLHSAAQAGHRKVAKLLLRAGASTDMVDSTMRTPAIVASQAEKSPIVELITTYKCRYAARKTVQALCSVLAMSKHDRLGADSPLGLLPQYLLKKLAALAAQAEALPAVQEAEEAGQLQALRFFENFNNSNE